MCKDRAGISEAVEKLADGLNEGGLIVARLCYCFARDHFQIQFRTPPNSHLVLSLNMRGAVYTHYPICIQGVVIKRKGSV
jgi:hypothetical protein